MAGLFYRMPALVMFAVSAAYFAMDIGETRRRVRLMVSAHGALGALLYLGALLLWAASPTVEQAMVLPMIEQAAPFKTAQTLVTADAGHHSAAKVAHLMPDQDYLRRTP